MCKCNNRDEVSDCFSYIEYEVFFFCTLNHFWHFSGLHYSHPFHHVTYDCILREYHAVSCSTFCILVIPTYIFSLVMFTPEIRKKLHFNPLYVLYIWQAWKYSWLWLISVCIATHQFYRTAFHYSINKMQHFWKSPWVLPFIDISHPLHNHLTELFGIENGS